MYLSKNRAYALRLPFTFFREVFLEIQVNTNCFDAFWEILCNSKIHNFHVQGIDIKSLVFKARMKHVRRRL